MAYKSQVEKRHYDFSSYVKWERWQSYYYQLSMVLSKSPNSILVVGAGDYIVVNTLRHLGIDVETADIDEVLNPDYLVSVTELSTEITRKFDLVLCCQVLEHVPFDQFGKTLLELKKIAKKNIIISLPYRSFRILNVMIGLILCPKCFISLRLPRSFSEFRFDGEHYWELGAKGYGLPRIRKIIEKHFKLIYESFAEGNPYHYFFDLEV